MLLLFFLCLSWYVLSQNQMTIPLTGNPVQTTATFNIDMQYTGTTFKSISYGYLSGLGVSMFGGQCYGPADPTAVQRLRLMNKEGVRLAQHAGVRYGRYLRFVQPDRILTGNDATAGTSPNIIYPKTLSLKLTVNAGVYALSQHLIKEYNTGSYADYTLHRIYQDETSNILYIANPLKLYSINSLDLTDISMKNICHQGPSAWIAKMLHHKLTGYLIVARGTPAGVAGGSLCVFDRTTLNPITSGPTDLSPLNMEMNNLNEDEIYLVSESPCRR